jgi:hypothetical protein
MTVKKCPKCKAKIDDENELIVEQKYSTVMLGKMDAEGRVMYPDDVDLSSIDLDNCEDGEPKIIACEKCAGR